MFGVETPIFNIFSIIVMPTDLEIVPHTDIERSTGHGIVIAICVIFIGKIAYFALYAEFAPVLAFIDCLADEEIAHEFVAGAHLRIGIIGAKILLMLEA